MHVAVTGSTGLIGSALVADLEDAGHRVLRVGRPETKGLEGGISWDPGAGSIDAGGFEGVDAVVNLAGRSIGDRRWDEREKRLLAESRIEPTRLLSETLAGLDRPPAVLLNASAMGVYGDRGDEVLTEDSGPGEGFFPDLCVAWEDATTSAAQAGIRVATLRTAIVLSPTGGALGRMMAPFGPRWLSPYRWGLGGWLGNGKQWWSWISLEDQIRAIIHLLDSDLSGPVNLAAPDPVRNKEFVKAVGRALRRPVALPIPRFVLDVVLGRELAAATLFETQRVVPAKLLGDGFEFRRTDLDDALRAALGAGS
jgi:uncharacterized protein (TIGR01777 family)